MKLTSKNIKRTLKKLINELSMQPNLYAKSVGKDFSRNRKLPFKKVVYTIGLEDRKLLLFDDFTCWKEGEYV